jgi:endonuclease VIII-like 1
MMHSEDETRVLAYCDPLRFGSWAAADFDVLKRSPDPTTEFEAFRRNILINLRKSAFDKPICEVLLQQQYFNGIGNYLRAEILHRAGVEPFTTARDSLLQCFTDEELSMHTLQAADSTGKHKPNSNLLSLCRDVPLEVVNMGLNYFAPDLNAGS